MIFELVIGAYKREALEAARDGPPARAEPAERSHHHPVADSGFSTDLQLATNPRLGHHHGRVKLEETRAKLLAKGLGQLVEFRVDFCRDGSAFVLHSLSLPRTHARVDFANLL